MTAMAAAQAVAADWGLAVKGCLERLGPLPRGATHGLVYVAPGFADDLASAITFLRETTPIRDWQGAVGHAVLGPEGESDAANAMALMALRFPPGTACPFDAFDPDNPAAFRARHGAWLGRQKSVAALVHADPANPRVAEMVAGMAASVPAFLLGGLAAADGAAPFSGLMLGDGAPLVSGLTQGCTPIGQPHRVTEAVDNVVMALDGRPAVEVLKAEAGELIARELRRAAGVIHVALPVAGSDAADYLVRNLVAIDPKRGWIAIAEGVVNGDMLMFVRRDPNAAQRDLGRMLDGIAGRLKGRTIRGGLYVSCVARGAHMFGRIGREAEMIHETLGSFPLVGFSASGEICNDRLYAYTGVLSLFL